MATQTTTTNIFWTASNNNSYLCGFRRAGSMRAAVRAARDYLVNELCGEGEIAYYDTDPRNDDTAYGPHPVRIDERSIFTRLHWRTRAPL